jgi:hypothetical protein
MLANSALLVSLNVSQWTARKLDKQATKEVAITHGVSQSVGSYHKSVLPASSELEVIKQCTGNVRTFYYDNTLPWAMDGARVLPNTNYLEFTNEMRALKSEWERAVSNFVQAYPQLRADAQLKLNGLFNPNDYPQNIEDKFSFRVTFMPVPQEDDFRIQLADDEKREFQSMLADAEKETATHLWNLLYEVTKHAKERLSDPDAIFRDTLVTNAVEVCKRLPRLNYNNDPELEAMRLRVESVLCNKSPEALRNLPSVREATADGLNDILSKMGAYMGA